MNVAIIGAGASGCFLAGLLARKGIACDLYEQSSEAMRKVLATGNGRCNFTNTNMSVSHYLGDGRLLEPILSDFCAVKVFKDLGLPSVTLPSGMTYPATFRADTVRSGILRQIPDTVGFFFDQEIRRITYSDGCFLVGERTYSHVVLATGGSYGIAKKEISIGYSIAKGFGHRITRLHPGIVALRVEEAAFCKVLSGLKCRVKLYHGTKCFEEDLLFTDYGISGIAVLQASNDVLRSKDPLLRADFLPYWESEELLLELVRLQKENPLERKWEHLTGFAPWRLVETVCKSMDTFSEMVHALKNQEFHSKGPRKKDRGQITLGGICTDDVTEYLESRLQKGLYFTGEILDIQGECGGYNLNWAFASAFRVMRAITNEGKGMESGI